MPAGSARGVPRARSRTGRPAAATRSMSDRTWSRPGWGRSASGVCGGVLRLAWRREEAEQVLQLDDGRPAAFLDGQQRRPGLVRRGAEYPPGGAGLHHHHADVVRHHVMQFAGDACPLIADRLPGGVLVLGLEPEQPGLRLAGAAVPPAHRIAWR